MTILSHAQRATALQDAFGSSEAVADLLGDVEVPTSIAAWLGRLHTLAGIPFGYLVPDEEMLPPESIRFFRIDTAWTQALLDGAFSLGRNLTADSDSDSGAGAGAGAGSGGKAVDRAVAPAVHAAARAAAPRRVRAPALVASTAPDPAPVSADPGQPVVWTGFLMRSRVVTDYPGLGVNAFPSGADGNDPAAMLTIVRLDRLGPDSDTLICIVDGDAGFFDIHEPPEHLHYGVDDWAAPDPGGLPAAHKEVRPFTAAPDGTLRLGPPDGAAGGWPVGAGFRAASPRVMKVAAMARILVGPATNNRQSSLDAAQLGFEMTEGVGNVRFTRPPT
jgi:hypothetical protein